MYTDNARISHRQLFRQILTGLLGIYFLVVPVLPGMRGRQGVLCLLTGAGVYGFLGIYFIRIRYFFQDPQRYMGKIWGKVFILLYTSWLWLMGVYLLLMTDRITGKYLIEGSPSWAVILLAAFAAYPGQSSGTGKEGENGGGFFSHTVSDPGRDVLSGRYPGAAGVSGRKWEN